MHSAKISDQKITKISKHQTGCARGYGQERAHGAGPGNPRLPRDPFYSPLFSREALLKLLITWEAPSQETPNNTFSQDSETSSGLSPVGSFA